MLDLLWEMPLGVSSLLFYRLNRAVLRRLYQRDLASHPARAKSWRPLSTKMFSQTGALACMMTTGPRWNPHAVIAAAGPIDVQSILRLDVACANASAGEWTVVVHSFPDHRLAGSIGRGHPTGQLDLPPGQYILFLRYYHCGIKPRLPAISADGQTMVAEDEIPPGINSFYDTLAARSSWYYRALHYYVFPVLKYRSWLPERWVAHEFLPVGNPESQFTFGCVLQGEELEIFCHDRCLSSFHVYLTLYNRASFPTLWQEITASESRICSPANGFYLTRQHLRAGKSFGDGWIEVKRLSREVPV